MRKTRISFIWCLDYVGHTCQGVRVRWIPCFLWASNLINIQCCWSLGWPLITNHWNDLQSVATTSLLLPRTDECESPDIHDSFLLWLRYGVWTSWCVQRSFCISPHTKDVLPRMQYNPSICVVQGNYVSYPLHRIHVLVASQDKMEEIRALKMNGDLNRWDDHLCQCNISVKELWLVLTSS